jgi:hypothetical protein
LRLAGKERSTPELLAVEPECVMTIRSLFLVFAAAAGLISATVSAQASPMHVVRSPRLRPGGELDCNGYSRIQHSIARLMPCADIATDDN